MPTIDTAQPSDQTPRPMLNGVYLLLLGITAGIMLGPWGLGWLAPQCYDAWFSDPVKLNVQLQDIENTRRKLAMTGVTEIALVEYDIQRQAEVDTLNEQLALTTQWTHWMNALLLASIMVLTVMNLVSRGRRLFCRLHFGAHLLLSAWLALLLAQPHMIGSIPRWGLAAALGLCVVVCLIPLGKCPANQTEKTDGH